MKKAELYFGRDSKNEYVFTIKIENKKLEIKLTANEFGELITSKILTDIDVEIKSYI